MHENRITQWRVGKKTTNKIQQTIIEKYWLTIMLLLLALTSFLLGFIAVLAALIFTFLVPGLIGLRFFRLKSHEIWAFVPIFSILVSVQLVYYLSLLLGYLPSTITLSFLILTTVYALVVYKKGEPIKPKTILGIGKIKKTSLLLFAIILLVSLVVLGFSVWRPNQNGIIVTGSNWQDTPFHFEIIESLNQGNFPPQTPNYIGTPLSYHYFVDFHTAIIENMYGYLPSLLWILNALFILVFGLAVYALARPYGRKVAIIATTIGVFGWGLSYFGLFSALFSGTFSPYQDYIYQFQKLFGLPSMFDNLLQQRPLLIGLPVFTLVLALLRNLEDKNRILLAGIATGLVYEFHNVAFFCCYIVFIVALLLKLPKLKLSYLYFAIPSVFALPFILFGGSSFNFSFSFDFLNTYAANAASISPLIYYPLNLGIPLALSALAFLKRGNEYLKITLLILFLIPNLLLLTPWSWDMYKFFMFAWIPIAVLSGIILAKIKWRLIVIALVIFSILTTTSVIIYNVGTDFLGATWNEYDAGLWIRDNTPQNSVFLTYYGIHEPPTMIGGRLRVSSYVYWPYGHGIPLGQVNQREQDIDLAYTTNQTQLARTILLYNVSYVYVGNEELNNYPNCVTYLNTVTWLTTIYAEGNIHIYAVDKSTIPTLTPSKP